MFLPKNVYYFTISTFAVENSLQDLKKLTEMHFSQFWWYLSPVFTSNYTLLGSNSRSSIHFSPI